LFKEQNVAGNEMLKRPSRLIENNNLPSHTIIRLQRQSLIFMCSVQIQELFLTPFLFFKPSPALTTISSLVIDGFRIYLTDVGFKVVSRNTVCIMSLSAEMR
jgi:hypothetical protein